MRKKQKQYQPEGAVYQLRGIPPELWRQTRITAAVSDRTLREVVLDALKKYLEAV